MITAKEVTDKIESYAPLDYQESYDNAGWVIGDPERPVEGVLIAIDMTMEVLDDAILHGENLIITHHPLLFKPLRRLLQGDLLSAIISKAIKHDIMIYSAHTNIDNAWRGVNRELSDRLGLLRYRVLRPGQGILKKLVVFVPDAYADKVRQAVFSAGAGEIGDYAGCSYNLQGKGSFLPGEHSDPFVGKKGKLHFEPEQRVETIFPKHLQHTVTEAMLKAHPYEEVAFDIYPLENLHERTGFGGIGEFKEPMLVDDFLELVKTKLQTPCLRYSGPKEKKIQRVALCGGAGQFLIRDAIQAKADVFLSGDLKYHDFFRAEKQIVIVDAGHFETEQFTKDLFHAILIENFSTFAVRISQVNTNPVNYF
ncbi:MAG: Nif3-like dinuclear metal center hexameric protein [Bacteroidales bacterium]